MMEGQLGKRMQLPFAFFVIFTWINVNARHFGRDRQHSQNQQNHGWAIYNLQMHACKRYA